MATARTTPRQRRGTPSILTALNKALKAAGPDDLDAPLVALTKRYALELDDAAVISKATTKSLAKLAKVEGADEIHGELLTLAARIEEAHIAATLGPKLLSALEQLQMTPQARSAVVKPTEGGGANAGSSALDELRGRRENRAKAVDPATS